MFLLVGALTAPAAQLPRPTLVREIGCESCASPTAFGSILEIAVDDDGAMLVVNTEPPMLRRFGADGLHRWSAGTAGAGPGEFRLPIGVILGANRVQIVDMTQRRVTRLDTLGRYLSSARLRGFPIGVSPQGRSGNFAILFDDFRGGRQVEKWTPTDSGRPAGTWPGAPASSTELAFSAVALSADGVLALARNINEYRIALHAPDGSVRTTLTRDIPRVPRSAEEIAALERIRERAAARVSAERGRSGSLGGAASRRPVNELKPHLTINGLQFDDAGRLWAATPRGDHTLTVFDVFAAEGRFLGEVRIPGVVRTFALAGRWLLVATEAEDGYPVVRLYSID